MAGLPLALFAFAAGATLLQWQPALPPIAPWLGGAALAAVGALGARLAFGRHANRTADRRGCRPDIARVAAAVLAAAAACALGFGYAAWRAQLRLADELPRAWEGADIALVGVVDELPQASARGTRFAFAVERIETPHAVVPARLSLAWYAQTRKDGASEPPPSIAAGERWRLAVRLKRPHGNVNPHG